MYILYRIHICAFMQDVWRSLYTTAPLCLWLLYGVILWVHTGRLRHNSSDDKWHMTPVAESAPGAPPPRRDALVRCSLWGGNFPLIYRLYAKFPIVHRVTNACWLIFVLLRHSLLILPAKLMVRSTRVYGNRQCTCEISFEICRNARIRL